MSVANIFNVPGDNAQLYAWSRLHMLWHRSAIAAVLRQFNVILPEYVLDPIDARQGGVFLRNHQNMHDDLDVLLGISSYNLIDVEWDDDQQREGWFQDHATQTRQEADALGGTSMSEVLEKPVFVEVPVIPVRRAFAQDITDVEPWLMPKLQAIYPAATVVGLRSALMHASMSNEQWVGRTQNAFAAIRCVQEHLSGVPVSKVWFALAKNGADDADEIAELHDAMLKWMRPAGMTVMILSQHIDCDRSYIRHRIGSLTRHDVYAWHAEGQKGAK